MPSSLMCCRSFWRRAGASAPHRDPHGETSGTESNGRKSAGKDDTPDRKGPKRTRRAANLTPPNQLVRMRSPVRIWVAAPKIPENCGFRGFFVAKSYFTGWPKISDPHRDPHAEMRQRKQWTQERRTGRRTSCPAYFSFCPYRTCSIKLPMVWAASSCFCLVAWV